MSAATQAEAHTDNEQVLARSGRTFHLASRLLPKQMREDATALYAFCRRMDDLADTAELTVSANPGETAASEQATPVAGGSQTNQRLLEQTLHALEEDPLGEEAAALGWPVELEERFPQISRVALRLTQSLAADTGPCRIATQDALQQYAFGVAGTVGLMMCRILGAPPAGAEAASHLGIAMQLTNIARDVREDLGRDRIYLPAEWIVPLAVNEAVSGGDPALLIGATRQLLALAEVFYVSAQSGMHYLPWRARVSIQAAAGCYREIGRCVGQDIPASWRNRVVVSRGRKASLVLDAFARSLRLPGSFFRRSPSSAGNISRAAAKLRGER